MFNEWLLVVAVLMIDLVLRLDDGPAAAAAAAAERDDAIFEGLRWSEAAIV